MKDNSTVATIAELVMSSSKIVVACSYSAVTVVDIPVVVRFLFAFEEHFGSVVVDIPVAVVFLAVVVDYSIVVGILVAVVLLAGSAVDIPAILVVGFVGPW